MTPLLLTVEGAANALGIKMSQVEHYIKVGEIPVVKVRRWRYVPTESLRPWVKRREAETKAGQSGIAFR